MPPNIRTLGTWIASIVSVATGAIIPIFPNQAFVASLVLALSILLLIICIGWYLIALWYNNWSTASQIIIILLCGTFIGIYLSAIPYFFGFPFNSFLKADEARLYLNFTDDQTTPVAINKEDVAYWHSVWTMSVIVNELDPETRKVVGGYSIPPHWDIFIIFDKPPRMGQLVVKCDGPNNPKEAPPVVSGIYQLLSGRSQPFSYAVRIGGVPHSAGVS